MVSRARPSPLVRAPATRRDFRGAACAAQAEPAASERATPIAAAATGPRRPAQRANGVRPLRPSTLASSTPRVNGGERVRDHAAVVDHRGRAGVGGAQHRPLRTRARACARCCRCWSTAIVVAEPADVAEVGEDRRRRRSGRRSAPPAPRRTGPRSRCWARRARRRTRTTARSARPRLKSPSGMFISSVNQRKPVGMNSPNGTRWCLS